MMTNMEGVGFWRGGNKQRGIETCKEAEIQALKVETQRAQVSLKHDGTDGTVKMASLPVLSVSDRWDTQMRHTDRTLQMARLPVLSAKKLGKYC